MVDFLRIKRRQGKRGVDELYPGFFVIKSSDLMIKNNEFKAIWLEDQNRWSTEEDDAISLIDYELNKYYEENKNKFDVPTRVLYIRDAENGMIDRWHKFCKNQMIETYHKLDQKIVFANTETTKKDYASIRLPYPLEPGETPAYNKLMHTLYSDEELHKLEWAIGAIVTGESKRVQKFIVMYGDRGTGKSTVMDLIAKMFDGYCSVFDAKSLGSSNQQFALEAFRDNPLVSIQHDGDLSKLEDNTRLNSVVSHEKMIVNEKNKSLYKNDFKTFLFIGSNNPVKITDARSGLLRRLIDVSPTGNLLPVKEYNACVKQMEFELGAIAWHCKEVFLEDPLYYEGYVPVSMLGASNTLYNFVMDTFFDYAEDDGITLDSAWKSYKLYCEESRIAYPLSKPAFREDLKPYFKAFKERFRLDDGSRVRSYYIGFKKDKYTSNEELKPKDDCKTWLQFEVQPSILDEELQNCPAQYASETGTPIMQWSKVETTLASIDTTKLHYVMPPMVHIVADFDKVDENGEKSLELNMEEASKWPPTYAELSKSGAGIHLHYIYTGDPSKVSRIYGDHVEIKVFTGNASLRRMLSKCNNLPIATISSGLPLKEEKKSTDGIKIKTQKKLLEMIERNLNKEFHGATKPSCDFIYKIVEDAYNDGFSYEIPAEMREKIMNFAKNSTHQSDACVKLMKKMHYCSKDLENTMDNNNRKLRELIKKIYIDENLDPVGKIDQIFEALDNAYYSKMLYDLRDIRQSLLYFATDKPKGSENVEYCLGLVRKMKFSSEDPMEDEVKSEEAPIIFYDIEVYPNLLLVAWMFDKEDGPVIKMFNPTAQQVEDLIEQFRLIGFNCRRYDNHEMYARTMGWDNDKLYKLSQKIINGTNRDCFFGEAYGISYTDVYDFASAGNKMSLKKLEIKMGIHHQEMGIPWDQPVPEEQWPLVGEYCENDVRATRKAFYYLKGDWTARQILADLANMTVNDTTNSLTQRIIFGRNRNPQDQFCYWDLSKPVKKLPDDVYRFLSEACPDMMSQTHGPANSLLPYWPGYKFEAGVSTYRGEVVGEGGYVSAVPGIHLLVFLLDIASMHPHSLIALCLFGPIYTAIFKSIVDGRINIKHEAWSKVDKMLDGKLKPYVQKCKDGLMTSKELANALKTAINAVYGQTCARYPNPFKDERNKDNIVAKRGALFMVDLKYAVQEKGFTVAHIKTDSIKIPNATPEIVEFVMEMGRSCGYEFEHEATYEKMCLVNDAVYIAKYADGAHEFELPTGEKIMTPWTATGDQFKVPYVFKTLFSKTPYNFDDFCETKSVSSSIYLDFNENLPDVTGYEKDLKKILKEENVDEEAKADLEEKIANGHNYQFIGRVGQFCPVVPGCGGGVMYRVQNDKYYAVEGTTGYRWMESEVLRQAHPDDWQNYIDMSYYKALADKAVEAISKYGDFEWFAS